VLKNFCTSNTDVETFTDGLDWIELAGLERTKLITKLKDIRSELIRAQEITKIGIIIDLDDSSVEDEDKIFK
ncbi:aldolase/synthase, partial [Acinetobacter baumannii]